MRTPKQKLAIDRNWDLFQIAGMESHLRKFQLKYPSCYAIFGNLHYELERLRAVVKSHYERRFFPK